MVGSHWNIAAVDSEHCKCGRVCLQGKADDEDDEPDEDDEDEDS